MRASTLFALTAAILIGLGVAVWAKMSGYFNKQADTPVVKKVEPQILVAAKNLFAGDTIESNGVRVRPLKTPEEVKAYEANPKNYLPALAAAAQLRVASKNIEADTPITYDALKEFAKPNALNERLLPDMRAVNIVLPKDRSAGGLIQVGEWVEVYLTSNIDGEGIKTTRTAVIAPKVRVIAKRDTLWPVFAPLPKDKPVEYTIEVNAYRAAMIEFARNKGLLSMSPLPSVEQKKLEANRAERLVKIKNGESIVEAVSEGQDDVKDEVTLVQSVEKAELVISDMDLAKLFDLKLQIDTQPPEPATHVIERFVGTRRAGSAVFTLDGKPYAPTGLTGGRADGFAYPPAPYSQNVNLNTGLMIPNSSLYQFRGVGGARGGINISAPSYRFSQPDCPTCKKNK